VLHRTDNRTTSKFARESLTLLLDEMRSATERNTTLHKLTCRMLRSGIYFDDAIAELASVALDTGLDPHEVARTIESARRTVTQ
jgi:hypothetical protein